MNLKESRYVLITVLYNTDIRKESIEFSKEYFNILAERNMTEKEFEISLDILSKLEVIDKTIEENLENYTLSRLNLVDLQIIRVAVYELMFTDTASAIIIDSAVELSKSYTEIDDFKSSKFNNKLLDSIGKKVRG